MTDRTRPVAAGPTRRSARSAAAVPLLAGALLLAGCSAGSEPDAGVPSNPHGTEAPGAGAPSGTAGGPASSSPGVPGATQAADARPDQRAAGAAAGRAASFGFTNQVSATDAEITRTREQTQLRRSNTSGTTVEPAECKSPLTAVDWSPILMPGADSSRVDFGSETFAGTGTVEVATLEDPRTVDEHLADVERLVTDCPELTMTVTDENLQQSTFDFTARASGAEADSALVWTREPAGGGAGTTAQVLISEAGDHVVMVSFIGQSQVAGAEFTTMAEEVLAAAVETL